MTNLVLLEKLKAKYGKVKGSGEWLSIPCPTCAPHNRAKMKRTVPAYGYTSNCFICGVKMDVADLLDGYYIPNAKDMAERPDEEERKPDPRALVLPYSSAIPINELGPTHPAVKFLNKDSLFDLDTYANVHKIVFVPYSGGHIFSNGKVFISSAERIIFPVYFSGKLVGWQMRSVPGTFYGDQPDNVRYYHLFNKGSYLYNYDQVKANHRRVIVVEGVKKALK